MTNKSSKEQDTRELINRVCLGIGSVQEGQRLRDYIHDLQNRVGHETSDDCAPYLKEGETHAECIARNRADTDSALTLLAQEKRKNEAQPDLSELHRLIEDGWRKTRMLLPPDESPHHWMKDIHTEWVEVRAGRRAQKTSRDDPLAGVRWICNKCTTVNGIDDEACLGCRKPREEHDTRSAGTRTKEP